MAELTTISPSVMVSSTANIVQPGPITLETIGVPRVSGPEGEALTPVGARQRAILVVLALSPRMTVGRRWLQTLLWSDSTPQQSSANLRQALALLRKCLGGFADILGTNRSDIWLDSARVQVDLLHLPRRAHRALREGRELLEGIDIESEGFEDWLRQERTRLFDLIEQSEVDAVDDRPPPATELPVIFTATDNKMNLHPLEMFMAESINAQLTQTAQDTLRTEVRVIEGGIAPHILSPGARFTTRVCQINGEFAAIARITEDPGGKVLWLRQARFDAFDSKSAVDTAASLAMEATEVLAHQHSQAGAVQRANALASTALSDVFSFDTVKLRRAIDDLAEAQALDPHAPRPALQALAHAFLTLETYGHDYEALRAQTRALMENAMSLDANNALALSFLADVHDLVFEDSQMALSLTNHALRANPGLGYAYASLGALELRRGNGREALVAAQRAQRQLENSSLEVFSLMRLCVASMTLGELETAERAAAKAADLAPTSRPPLRHLYALRLARGDYAGARDALVVLRRLEPHFSMAHLRENPDFPAATIRNLGFHKLTDVDL